MIDSGLLKRLLLLTAVLLLVSAGAAAAAGAPRFAGGLALGVLLGATPFATWGWIAARAMQSGKARIVAVLLLISKLGFYAGALYLCVTKELVNPVGVLTGITGVSFLFILGSLLGKAAPVKEAV